MDEEITAVTIYEGTVPCTNCDYPMTPIEALYSDDGLCPYCRNMKYEKYARKMLPNER